MIVRKGPVVVAADAGKKRKIGYSLAYPIFLFFLSLWETARYRLKYRLRGPLNIKQSVT